MSLPDPQAGKEILLVEDSATQAEQLRQLLEQHGYETRLAGHGRAALAELDRRLPTLIISDILMPEMDGYELCRRVRADSRLAGVPLILLTALADPKDLFRGLECGADGFITKPYTPGHLLARIAHVLGNRASHEAPDSGPGTEIDFRGEHFVITAGRRRILELLLSSYETAVQKNLELIGAQDQLRELNAALERKIELRTSALREEIARREQTERALHQRLTEIEQIYRYAPVGLFLIDGDQRFVRLNERLAQMSGLPVEAHLGRRVQEVMPGLAPRLDELLRPVFERGEPVLDVEIQGTAPAGREWLASFLPFTAEQGSGGGLIGAVLDITERKHAEETRRLLAAIVESSDDAIIGKALDGTVLSWNPGAERLYGYSAAEMIGRRVTMLASPGSYEQEILDRIGRGERLEHFETVRLRKDGTEVPVSLTISPIKDAAGRVIGAATIGRDISARKQAERAVQQTNAELTRALAELRATQQQVIQSEKLAAVGTLSAGVAHELNNPLMGVMGYVGFARETAQDPEAQRLLARAGEELERMQSLVRNLLGLARPGSAEPLSPVAVPAVLERTLALLQPEFKVRGITVTAALGAPLPPVLARADQLQQVLLNLLMNARDAVEGQPRREIRVEAVERDGRVVVSVHDSGRGIEPEIRGRIFEPFFTTKPPGKGTGLGLSIVQNVVAEFGGTVTCESTVGQGTIFTLAFSPAPAVPRPQPGPPSPTGC